MEREKDAIEVERASRCHHSSAGPKVNSTHHMQHAGESLVQQCARAEDVPVCNYCC
jgi:hypothetical protein